MADDRRSQGFEPVTHQVRAARQFVAAVLSEWAITPTGDALLVVSELATNAVVHAGSRFTVTVRRNRQTLFIEVADPNPSMPVLAPVQTPALSGRGLLIVQDLSVDWGVSSQPGDGKTVWAQLR